MVCLTCVWVLYMLGNASQHRAYMAWLDGCGGNLRFQFMLSRRKYGKTNTPIWKFDQNDSQSIAFQCVNMACLAPLVFPPAGSKNGCFSIESWKPLHHSPDLVGDDAEGRVTLTKRAAWLWSRRDWFVTRLRERHVSVDSHSVTHRRAET